MTFSKWIIEEGLWRLMGIFKPGRYLRLTCIWYRQARGPYSSVPSSETLVSFSSSPFSHTTPPHRSSAIYFFLFPVSTAISRSSFLRLHFVAGSYVVEKYVTVTSTNFILPARSIIRVVQSNSLGHVTIIWYDVAFFIFIFAILIPDKSEIYNNSRDERNRLKQFYRGKSVS